MDQHNDEPSDALRIGAWTVLPNQNRIRKNGTEKSLQYLTMQLLVYLAGRRNEIVSQKELLDTIWKGRVTGEYSVHGRIADLRRALADDAKNPRYIETIPKRGYRLIASVGPVRRLTLAKGSRVAIAAVILAAAAVAAWSLIRPPPAENVGDRMATGAVDIPSLAVLPFENLSPLPDDSFFATGLHEELIDRLARIDGLNVVSRQSVQRYFQSPTATRDVARELGADAVMEGTVRYRNGHVRIRTQLVDPESGIQLWTSTYERNFSDIFKIQNDIAESVAGALGVKLGILESNAFRGAGTTNIDAYEAFLAGLHIVNQVQGHDRAMSFFERAAELDPRYAAAWAQMGFAVAARTFYSPPERTGEVLEQAMPLLLRAVELDPKSARAAAMLGFVRYFRLDWIGAERDYVRAIDLHADRLTLAQHAGMLARAGRLAAARSEFDAAESIEPSFGWPAPVQIQVSIGQGRYTEARELASMDEVLIRRQRLLLNIAFNEGGVAKIKDAISELMAVDNASLPLYSQLLQTIDSPEAALAVVRSVHSDDSVRWPSKQHDVALAAAYLGDQQLAIRSMSHEVDMTRLRMSALWYPVMADIRQLPEFKELVTRLNLVAYWRAHGWPDACTPIGEADFRCW